MSTADSQFRTRLYEISPLEDDGSNYQGWKARQEMVLDERDLFGYIDGTTSLPTEPSDPPTSSNKADWTAYEKALKEWTTGNRKARNQLCLTLRDGLLIEVQGLDSARDVWLALSRRWDGHGQQSAGYLLQKLWTGKMEEDGSVADFARSKRTIAAQLKALDDPTPASHLAHAFIINLPPSWSMFHSNLAAGRTKLDFELVVVEALAEEQRRKETLGDGGYKALISKMAGGKIYSRGGSKHVCSNCGRPGHLIERCWAKGGGAEGKGPNRGRVREETEGKAQDGRSEGGDRPAPKAMMARQPSKDQRATDSTGAVWTADPSVQFWLARMSKSERAVRGWVVDSGASEHFAMRRGDLASYSTLFPPVPIVLADNSTVEAVGIGSACISGLLGNAISVRALTREGAEVRFEGEGVRMRFSNRQEGTATWRDGLYFLDGTMPLSDPIREAEGEGGVDTGVDARTPGTVASLGEGVYRERGGVASVGVTEAHGRDSNSELFGLDVKSAGDTTDGGLTEGRIEREKAADTGEGERACDCVAADDPKAPIHGLSRQYELVTQRDGGNTHGHEPRRADDIKTAFNVETRTKREVAESHGDLPLVLAPNEASIDSKTAHLRALVGVRVDGDVGAAIGRGCESGEGELEVVGREVSCVPRDFQAAKQPVRGSEHGKVIYSPVFDAERCPWAVSVGVGGRSTKRGTSVLIGAY